jgi:hypothetical protein
VALVLVWLFSTRWEVVWRGVWFWPRVDILFARFTTVMYVPPGVQAARERKVMKRTLLVFVAAGLLLWSLTACGGGEEPAVAFCSALSELNETAPTIAALGEAATLAQIVQLGAAMDNNWQDLSRAAEGMDDTTQAVFAPYDEQYTAIPAITQQAAMPVARASLEAKSTIVTAAYDELYAGRCQ